MLGGTTSTCAGTEIWSATLTVGSTGPAGSRLSGYRVTPGVEAGIGRLVLGARHAGMRKYGDAWLATPGGYGRYVVETLLDLTNRELDLVTGVRTHECEQLRAEWKR